MTRWHFQRRSDDALGGQPISIDASGIRRRWMVGKTREDIGEIQLAANGLPTPLADLFQLTLDPSQEDQIVVSGDLQNVHGLGCAHDSGQFLIRGNAGDFAACGMTGGSLSVDGDAGDFVGAPWGSRKLGMSGGQIYVGGSVGDYAGHRMRRGTLLIGGSAGGKLAASMIAGTICVGGEIGDDLAIGMKRGTILLANAIGLVSQADAMDGCVPNRFSPPVRFEPDFLRLYSDHRFQEAIATMLRLPIFRTRADRTVGGLGEIIFAATAALALG